MNLLKVLLKILLTAGAALQLTACSKTVQWEEEVPLNTGETIWVKRYVTYKFETTQDNPFAFQYWPMGDQAISFKLKGRDYRFVGANSLILLAVSPSMVLSRRKA